MLGDIMVTKNLFAAREIRKDNLAKLVSATLAFATLSGCATDGTLSPDMQKLVGAGVGAVAGYAACNLADGNDTQCMLAAIAGAGAGYLIAKQIAPKDKAQRDETVGTVLTEDVAVGETKTYTVSETGSSGSVKLLALTTDERGWQCKQLSEDYDPANTDAINETYTMCQNPETGEWANA